MHAPTTQLVRRAMGRIQRLSLRTSERVRGWPLRAAESGRGVPVPPPKLIHLVAGTMDVAWYLEGGRMAADSMCEILARNGRPLSSFQSILDFGCGVGRVIRHLPKSGGSVIQGCDYNSELIAWCRRHLTFARFDVNGLEAGLPYADASMDLVYAFSVFTHLPEQSQLAWMGELKRILRPGGCLVFSLHGEYYLDRLRDDERCRFRAGELIVHGTQREGSNDCAAFHPEAYVRERLAAAWDVVERVAEGALGNPRQDLYLLRKPMTD